MKGTDTAISPSAQDLWLPPLAKATQAPQCPALLCHGAPRAGIVFLCHPPLCWYTYFYLNLRVRGVGAHRVPGYGPREVGSHLHLPPFLPPSLSASTVARGGHGSTRVLLPSQVVYFTATFPFAMLLVLLVRGLTLPGAGEGIKFYLYPNITRLADPQVCQGRVHPPSSLSPQGPAGTGQGRVHSSR